MGRRACRSGPSQRRPREPPPCRQTESEHTLNHIDSAPILDSIDSLSDLKALPAKRLPELAQEVRQKIISTVSRTGGHLAPNLGVVELTITLHRVFDSPRDRIVWDVGHQTYTHKLLTGRLDRFDTLRQEGGLSGFPRRDESTHDVFEVGHASTSISAALGVAQARDIKGQDFSVVAVIGDGALTGGMAFEALNNAGHMKTSLIVVLNDNELSYGPTVGGLAAYLGRMRTHPAYAKFRRDLERVVKGVPLIGPGLFYLGGRLKGSLKYLVVKGMLFEELGFTYLGPIDGHNFPQLEDYLNRAKRIKGPVFVHVLTKKGKGYGPAEADPDRFHGTGPFDVATGTALDRVTGRPSAGPSTSINGFAAKPVSVGCPAVGQAAAGLDSSGAAGLNKAPGVGAGQAAIAAAPGVGTPAGGGEPQRLSYTQAFGRALLCMGQQDNRIVAITAAMASSTGVLPFARAFPKRWFDVGICEQHAVTFAAGLAREGLKPVVAVYSTFLQRAYDQILHDVCLQGLPVVFALDRAGLVGADGPTHHGVYDFAYLRSMPGMTVMAPRDENELQSMLRTALDLGAPAALRYPRGLGLGVDLEEEPQRLEIGRAEVLREGGDAAILAVGSMVERSLEAGTALADEGVEAAVVNARFVAPLDKDLILRLARETGLLVTVEEHVAKGGFGGAVAEVVADAGLTGVRLVRLALPDEPVEHGNVDKLLHRFHLDAEGIAAATLEALRPGGNSASRG